MHRQASELVEIQRKGLQTFGDEPVQLRQVHIGHGLHGLLRLCRTGLEPIAVQMSGGHLLQPVRKLAATIIFTEGENANRVRLPAP